jgi:hypothetical protein
MRTIPVERQIGEKTIPATRTGSGIASRGQAKPVVKKCGGLVRRKFQAPATP